LTLDFQVELWNYGRIGCSFVREEEGEYEKDEASRSLSVKRCGSFSSRIWIISDGWGFMSLRASLWIGEETL
jgi:hypothetical protein